MSVVMEMDLYVSNLGWGVVMVLVQKQNCTSRWLKLHASVSQFLVLNVHIHAYLGSWGLFSKLLVSANHRLVRICIY
jgi:hypothetical protein